ncbi:MAG: hypothetical protein EYC62_04030 [Alphaproteobacteria bacterium]|nr:MAG: hypothetical protein EYC62_04030 [Alphaproteobacteria bacterium]
MPRNYFDSLRMMGGVAGWRNSSGQVSRSSVRATDEPAAAVKPQVRAVDSLHVHTDGHSWNLQGPIGEQLTFVHSDGQVRTMSMTEYRETEAVTDIKAGKQMTIGKVMQTWEARSLALAGASLFDANAIRAARWRDGQMVR